MSLSSAILEKDDLLISKLIKNGCDIHEKDNYLRTPLHYAVKFKLINYINMLLALGSKVNDQDCNGITPLHIATINGDYDSTILLLSFGANVNSQNCLGRTPLHNIVLHNVLNKNAKDEEIIKILLSMNASPDVKDIFGNRPTSYCDNKNIIDMLLCINKIYN